jgi:hypothetical protein
MDLSKTTVRAFISYCSLAFTGTKHNIAYILAFMKVNNCQIAQETYLTGLFSHIIILP